MDIEQLPPTKQRTAQQIREKVHQFFKDWQSSKVPPSLQQNPLIIELTNLFLEITVENEELRNAFKETNLSRTHYYQYYDRCPMPCFTISKSGILLEVNSAGANLFNIHRKNFNEQQHAFTAYLSEESYETFFQHLEQTLSQPEPRTCTLKILEVGDRKQKPITLQSQRIKHGKSSDWQCLSFAL